VTRWGIFIYKPAMISGNLTLLKFIGGCQVFKVFIVKIISLSVISRQSMVSRGSKKEHRIPAKDLPE
jgi:hypothetical protein